MWSLSTVKIEEDDIPLEDVVLLGDEQQSVKDVAGKVRIR